MWQLETEDIICLCDVIQYVFLHMHCEFLIVSVLTISNLV